MATTRLRRTFHYPADSDDDDAVEHGMDAQDQETLIATLSSRDTSSTALYTRILLLLPLAPVLLYLPLLLSIRTVIPSLAAIASLLASAYVLYFLPLPPVRALDSSSSNPDADRQRSAKGKAILRDASGARSENVFAAPSASRPVPYLSEAAAELLRRYAVLGNGVVCAVLALLELFRGRSWSEGMMIGGGYVPGVIFAFTLWARRELRVVDLGELERLRYGGKSG